MKVINSIILLASAAFAIGCVNPVEVYDAVYMTEAQSNPDKTITVDTPPSGASFTVSSSVKATEDILVELEVRPDLIEGFNAKYGKNYKMAPEGSFELGQQTAIILAGQNMSEAIDVTVKSMADFAEGTTYCIPVSIKSTSAMKVLEPSRTLFIVIKSPVYSKAIRMSGNKYYVPSFQEDGNLSAVRQVTMEARVYFDQFVERDPYISSIMGIEGICAMRLGDVKVSNNAVQICHESYQPAAENMPLEAKKWYHVAAVWSGTSWDIYIDGQYAAGVPVQGETIDLTSDNSGGFQVGASYGQGRPMYGYIAEVRVWTKALSQAEIANNMNYVDPKSDGLLAYWRMNKHEDGNIIPDETGHGYQLVGRSQGEPAYMDTKWL